MQRYTAKRSTGSAAILGRFGTVTYSSSNVSIEDCQIFFIADDKSEV